MTRIILTIAIAAALPAKAQQPLKNTAFKGGETLEYKMYFNWKFIWLNAGTATMKTTECNYAGKKAYRCALTTRSSAKIDKYFRLRDTLLCYTTYDLIPLYYRKGAREGKRYTVDEVFYSYPNGKCQVQQHRQHNSGRHSWQKHTYDECLYDMLSIFLRARSFNPAGWKKGHDVDFPIADGNGRTPAKLRFQGRETIKADNGRKYKCLQLSYMELEDGKYKRIVDFYVTDDNNHIPIRLDMFLKFGSAKAFLVDMKGVKG